jgi:hypothetical protein
LILDTISVSTKFTGTVEGGGGIKFSLFGLGGNAEVGREDGSGHEITLSFGVRDR